MKFTEAYQAEVREIGFAVCVARGEFGQTAEMFSQVQSGFDKSFADECQCRGAAFEMNAVSASTASQVSRGSVTWPASETAQE